MTEFFGKPGVFQAVRLSGKIKNYRCTRASASFVHSENDQHQMGIVAIAAAFAGMGGQAISVAGHASHLDEPADHIEFDLNGSSVKGWVWRSPFNESDVVDVAAEWRGDHYEAYGIARPADRIIALYPHCSRSRRSHFINSAKWWVIWNLIFLLLFAMIVLYVGGFDLLFKPMFFYISAFTSLFWVLMFVSLSRKYMPFVLLAEKVFNVLGIRDPKNVDLVKSSKSQRTVDDSIDLGTFYFKY
jgi:hypothetical protein